MNLDKIKIDNYELLNFTTLDKNTLLKILKWRNHPEIRKWMYNNNVISEEEHFKFVETLKKSENLLYFLVNDDKEHIGVLYFTNINLFHRRAYFGLYTNPDIRIPRAGIILENLAIYVAFNILNLHTLKLEVIENNFPIILLHKEIGFREEGRLKDFVYIDNKWKDVIIMGMINPMEKNKDENSKF